jgi:hypothetical protein
MGLSKIAEKVTNRRKEMEVTRQLAVQLWGQARTDFIFTMIPSEWAVRQLKRIVLKGIPFEDMVVRANRVIYIRIANLGRGQSNAVRLQPVDVPVS